MATFDQNGDDSNKSFDDPEGGQGSGKQDDGDSFVEYNGKKMSKEDVLKKLENADSHIQTLEGERSKDRDRVEKMVGRIEALEKNNTDMNDIMERLDYSNRDNADDSGDKNTIDEDQLMERAANAAYDRMNKEQQDAKKKANQQEISQKLQTKYGNEVDSKVFGITRELGYSDDEAFELAGARPKAFLRLIGFEEDSKNPSPTPNKGDVKNPSADDNDDGKLPNPYKAKNTKEQIVAFETRMQSKLKELGLES